MKRQLSIVLSILLSIPMIVNADTMSASGLRLWEISANNLSQADEILSKVCLLDPAIENSFVGTFTMLDQLLDKVCTIDSKVDVIDDGLGTANSTLITIESNIEVVDQNIDGIINTINVIRVDDFGGTWTALEELQSTLCDKFDTAFSDLDVIESKLDQLAGHQQSHFADTFTTLQAVSDNVLEILVELESLSEQLATDLSEVDICLETAIDIMCSVESKVDVIVEIPSNFAGTFTAIDELLEKACTVESKLDDLELTIENNQAATFTALAEVEAKLCTAASKADGRRDDRAQVKNA